MTTKTTTSTTAHGDQDTLEVAIHEVRGAIDGVRRTVPELARGSRAAIDGMIRTMETGSDDRTRTGVALSLGLALGMLLGGAPRLLILLSLAPVAAMTLVLGDRKARAARGAS